MILSREQVEVMIEIGSRVKRACAQYVPASDIGAFCQVILKGPKMSLRDLECLAKASRKQSLLPTGAKQGLRRNHVIDFNPRVKRAEVFGAIVHLMPRRKTRVPHAMALSGPLADRGRLIQDWHIYAD
jgi:hypothetical protein